MKLIHNKLFTFNLGDLSHSMLSHIEMIEHYKNNASPAGFFLEKVLPKIFSNIQYSTSSVLKTEKNISVTIKPDFTSINGKILYDQKTVKSNGVSWLRSKYKGANRKLTESDLPAHNLWLESQSFIFTDIQNLPEVRVITIRGKDLMGRFPTHHVGKNNLEELFEE